MDIDLKQVKEFVIRVENLEQKARLINIGDEGELIFEIPPGSQIVGTLNKRGEVSFQLKGMDYSFSGNVFSPEPQKIVVIKQTEIAPDKRREDRVEAQVLPAKIKEQGRFLEKSMEAYIMDMSKKGAKIETEYLLIKDKEYSIETNLGKKPFSAIFQIKNIKQREKTYIYGVMFKAMTTEDEKNLDRYLMEINNRNNKGDKFEKMDLSKLWKTI